jgi:uncharacterized protein (DUF58 family)
VIFTARDLAQIRRLEILAAKVAKGQLQGERQTARSGPGSGFRQHRAYTEGDPLRMVDWNVYARMESLVIKEFDAEEALDLLVIQDMSASMAGAGARCAAKVAGALGAIALGTLDRVLWMPAGGERRGDTYVGRARQMELLSVVDGKATGPTDLLAAIQAQLPKQARGGVAFVVSDFFDPAGATRALSFLTARRYQTRAIMVEDPEALAPPPLGRTRLVDRETGEAMILDVTEAMVKEYRRTLDARVRGLQAYCRRTGAGFLRVRADQPFFETVRAAIARGWLTP